MIINKKYIVERKEWLRIFCIFFSYFSSFVIKDDKQPVIVKLDTSKNLGEIIISSEKSNFLYLFASGASFAVRKERTTDGSTDGNRSGARSFKHTLDYILTKLQLIFVMPMAINAMVSYQPTQKLSYF